MYSIKSSTLNLAILLLAGLSSISLCAQIPTTLSYQGLLTDANGSPVADGNATLTFKFYKGASETIDATLTRTITVPTFKGLFTITLGSGTVDDPALPASLGDQPVSIGITPQGGAELSPRAKLTTVPYSFKAQSANTMDATGLTGSVADARLSAHLQDLADGSLTGSKVGTGINASNITSGTLALSGTDAAKMPNGTTAQRPASPAAGAIRYNTTESMMEFYNGTNWYFFVPKVLILQEEKTPGLDGGTFSSSTWQKRELNSTVPPSGDVTVVSTFSSSQFTLTPGEYVIDAWASAYNVLAHRIRLFNLTSNSSIAYGSGEYTTQYSSARSELSVRFSITSATQLELQGYCNQVKTTNGLGVATVAPNANEIYSLVKVTKLR